jgi:hypothetical protein
MMNVILEAMFMPLQRSSRPASHLFDSRCALLETMPSAPSRQAVQTGGDRHRGGIHQGLTTGQLLEP